MLDTIIKTFFFREWFSTKEKWFFAIFYFIIGAICLVVYFYGYIIIGFLKMISWFFGLLISK